MGKHTADDGTTNAVPDRTPIPPTSGRREAVLRRVSFWLLLIISGLSLPAALWFGRVWLDTFLTCLNTYIFRTQESVLLTEGGPSSWSELVRGLDISSVSALIVFLLFGQLAYSGLRNTVANWYRERRAGVDWWQHAYLHSRFSLIAPGFGSLCIQLGLLGTLLSFLLAAILQMSALEESAPAAEAETLGSTVESVVAAGGGPQDTENEESPSGGTEASVAGSDGAEPAGGADTTEFSRRFFMLLCASLVSTFVGCFVAYLVIRPLNLLNHYAVGGHQVARPDEETVIGVFLGELRRAGEQAGKFAAATEKLTVAAEKAEGMASAAERTEQKLDELATGFERSADAIAQSNRYLANLAQSMVRCQQMLEKSLEASHAQAARLDDTLPKLDSAASAIGDIARQTGDAVADLGRANQLSQQTAQASGEVAVKTASVVQSPVAVSDRNAKTTAQILETIEAGRESVEECRASTEDVSRRQDAAAAEQRRQAKDFEATCQQLHEAIRQLDQRCAEQEALLKHQSEQAAILKRYGPHTSRWASVLMRFWPARFFRSRQARLDGSHAPGNNGSPTPSQSDEEAT